MLYAQPPQYSILQGQGVPDGVLVEQALNGDQRAFENLIHRYHRPLLIFIRGFLKDGDQVYDVLQHVFFKLSVSLPMLLTNVSLKMPVPTVKINFYRSLPRLRTALASRCTL